MSTIRATIAAISDCAATTSAKVPSAVGASALFLQQLRKTLLPLDDLLCRIQITKVLADNGTEFADRPLASHECKLGGQHMFDQTCPHVEH